jgi:cytochrome P450
MDPRDVTDAGHAVEPGPPEAPRCPVLGLAADFDPFRDPYLDDPYAFFERARVGEPVFYSPVIDHWVVSRYDDVRTVMRDTERFSAANAQAPVTPWPADAVAALAAEDFGLRPNLSNNDPPSHTRVRHFLKDAFTPRRITWLEPHVRRLTNEAVDGFSAMPVGTASKQVDLVDVLLRDVPARVLFVFLGIPDADVDRVKRWSAGRAILTWGRPTDDEVRRELPGFIEYLRYCFDLVDDLERCPGDDYTSELLRRLAAEQPDDFDKGRVAQTLFGLLMAGHETTTNQAALGIRALLEAPGAWRRLAEHPELIPQVVEEVIRYDSSVIAWRRITRCPVVLSGVELPAGAQVLTLLGSANRDEVQFPGGSHLDIDRENARNHVSFGYGNHYCLGAPLARLELRVFLEVLTERLPDLELVPARYEYLPNTSHRGPRSLLVRWSRSLPDRATSATEQVDASSPSGSVHDVSSSESVSVTSQRPEVV